VLSCQPEVLLSLRRGKFCAGKWLVLKRAAHSSLALQAISLSGYQAIRLSAYLAIWPSGYLAIWLSGYLAIWLSGYLAIWLSAYLAVPCPLSKPHALIVNWL